MTLQISKHCKGFVTFYTFVWFLPLMDYSCMFVEASRMSEGLNAWAWAWGFSPLCVIMWYLKLLTMLNVLPHVLHTIHLPLWTTWIWPFKYLKDLLHISHIFNIFGLATLISLFILSISQNEPWQCLHLCCFSKVCLIVWFLSIEGSGNVLSHFSRLKGQSSVFLLKLLSKTFSFLTYPWQISPLSRWWNTWASR